MKLFLERCIQFKKMVDYSKWDNLDTDVESDAESKKPSRSRPSASASPASKSTQKQSVVEPTSDDPDSLLNLLKSERIDACMLSDEAVRFRATKQAQGVENNAALKDGMRVLADFVENHPMPTADAYCKMIDEVFDPAAAFPGKDM